MYSLLPIRFPTIIPVAFPLPRKNTRRSLSRFDTITIITVACVLIFLALTTYYYFTGIMLGNLGPLLTVPGLIGLGILAIVSWKTTGTPGKTVAILVAVVCWAIALATLPVGFAGLMSNFGG